MERSTHVHVYIYLYLYVYTDIHACRYIDYFYKDKELFRVLFLWRRTGCLSRETEVEWIAREQTISIEISKAY